MLKIDLKKHLPEITGIGTILVIFSMSVYWLEYAPQKFKQHPELLYFLFSVYSASFIAITRSTNNYPKRFVIFLLSAQLISAFAIMLNYPIEFLPILTIIWISIIPHYFSLRTTIFTLLLVLIIWFTTYQVLWQKQMLFSALLYSTFHFFAVLTAYHAKEAERATEKAERITQELMTTQQLLSESSKQNERTRIARDLHDLLGHHLTALLINLQVAQRLSDGEAKEKIEQCFSLAKLLMSDVREAVSTMKEDNQFDFELLVRTLTKNIPRLTVHTDIKINLPLDNINLSKQLLSCIQEAITNSLKHTKSTEFRISMTESKGKVHLILFDNGKAPNTITEGNGLTGMRERISDLKGKIAISRKLGSLLLDITVPFYPKSRENNAD